MRIKLLYFLIASIVVFFASCTNDENSDKTILMLPKKITYNNGEKIYQTETFTYDGNKIVSFSNSYIDIDFVYDGNRIVKEIQSRNYGENYTEKSYSYSNGSLKTVTKLVDGKETRFLYINNGDGTIKKEVYDFDGKTGKESKSDENEELIFVNGNLIKVLSNWGIRPYITTCRYDYDANNNAFKNILGLNLLLDHANFGSELNFSAANNINTFMVFTNLVPGTDPEHDSRIIFEPYSFTMKYEYNKKGYPTKKTTYDYKGDVREIIEYTY